MILLIIAFILFEYKYKYNNSFLEYFNNIHNLKNINSNSNILTFPINIFSILASMIIRLISWRLKIELKIKNQEVPLQRIHRTLSGFYNFYFDLVRRLSFYTRSIFRCFRARNEHRLEYSASNEPWNDVQMTDFSWNCAHSRVAV